MFTGTLIDDLMAAVDRAEERVSKERNSRDERVALLYSPASYEMNQADSNLLGAA